MKKIVSFLFSMSFTGILLAVFAVSIGYATFIENDYGTITAKILVYNSKWFEALLIILCINIAGSIFVNKLISKKKWTIFLFHVAFIFIIAGAAVTRYYSYEGMMHIREGESSNALITDATFISVKVSKNNQTVEKEKEVKFSTFTANRFSESLILDGQNVVITNLQFMPSATEGLVIDPLGEPMVSLITVDSEGQRVSFNLKTGNVKQINGVSIGFESSDSQNDFNLKLSNDTLFLFAKDSVAVSGMAQNSSTIISGGMTSEMSTQNIYSNNYLSFVVQQFLMKGKTQLFHVQPQQGMATTDALQTRITVNDKWEDVIIFGRKGQVGESATTNLNGVNVSVSYGSKLIELPFSLYLDDFELERYPGSNSPSSYASAVVLNDGNIEFPFRIYMNNILNYKGYRFFQSSYDTDELGTILSVNHDSLGTSITYFGYLIMVLGMVFTLFNKNSRFKTLLRVSKKLHEERKKLFMVLLPVLLFIFPVNAQQNSSLSKNHISEFETLLIQSNKGRVEPVSTLASEIVRKVAKKNSWQGMSPSTIFLDMHINPEKWKNIPFIKVANPELRNFLGTTEKHVAFNNIVISMEPGGYKLSEMVSAAYAKSNNERNKLDKEIINVDERVNILMNVFSGNFLTIIPVPGDSNQKWIAINELDVLDSENAEYLKIAVGNYFNSVYNQNWINADQYLQQLMAYQQNQGSEIIPDKTKIKLEVIYNNLNIFGKLSKVFMFTGLFLLVLQLLTLFHPQIKLTRLKKLALFFILILFIAETAGLTIRWYISGHAPWSNGYESMIFISWATCLGGLIFANRSEITLSLTTVLAGLTLMVAGMSWMSPEITNLVPVLKSYWLIVHVAIITASYGFLGIGALLGFLNLILMISRNKMNKGRVNFTIKELVNIIQIALMIGLLMLTIGSFIGGIWANESWGRYWGWDPKETWALVTILVYSFIGHMHKIPGFKGHYAISVAALLGISSVLMTYFGVNYYLSGLHSYAQGEPAPVPMGVFIGVAVAFIVMFAAFVSEKKMNEKKLED